MIPLERKRELLSLLEKQGNMTVNDLAVHIYVSPMTVRRDLKELEDEGLVRRSHGQVEIVRMDINSTSTFSYALRKTSNPEGKNKIAAAAFKRIRPGETIYIDSSSTASLITEYLTADMKLTVVTNSPQVTGVLADKGVSVCCTGGRYSELGMAFFGSFAERSARFFDIDAMFFSSLGFVPGDGIYDPNEEETSLRQCYLERSKRKYFLCDRYKIGKKSMFRLCGLESIDEVFCDVELPAAYKTPLSAGGNAEVSL